LQSPRLVLSASQQKAFPKQKKVPEAKVRNKVLKNSGQGGALSQSELALIAVDELRRAQNEALLRVLEEEQVILVVQEICFSKLANCSAVFHDSAIFFCGFDR
jgi:hypothetical protein